MDFDSLSIQATFLNIPKIGSDENVKAGWLGWLVSAYLLHVIFSVAYFARCFFLTFTTTRKRLFKKVLFIIIAITYRVADKISSTSVILCQKLFKVSQAAWHLLRHKGLHACFL